MSPAIRISGLRKRYGSTVALDGADLEIEEGSVHAVIGENGAGKSTLVKILSGLVHPDEGVIEYHGEPLEVDHPRHALDVGIATAFQELSLVPHLSVAENLAFPHQPRGRFGLVSGGTARRNARSKLEEWDVADVNVRAPVETLSLSSKQQIEIVGALAREPRLLILDEPTSALGRAEVDWLVRQIAKARKRGLTIIFVTHRLPEVRRLCDSLTVLRGGKRAGSAAIGKVTDSQIIQQMIGESLTTIFPERHHYAEGQPVALSARDIRSGGLQHASFEIRHREVLGIAGLQGHGQRDLFRALFGAQRLEAGAVELGGEGLKLRSPRDAIRSGMGISLVPEERALEGALLSMSGRANLTLPTLSRFTTLGWINRKKEKAAVEDVLRMLGISERALFEPVDAFSGGNQQKIVIGKWLLAQSKVLLLYDPTRGVDIRTKAEIYRLMREFAEQGGCVLFYSTDLDEIANLCDRAMVCYGGVVSESVEGDDLNSEMLLTMMLGGREEEVPVV